MKTLILGVFAFCAACRLSADTVYALVYATVQPSALFMIVR